MNKKIRLGLIGLGICLLFIFLTPGIRRHIRQEEGKIIPKVTVTEQIKPVPQDDIKALLAKQPKTTLIILNAQNTKLNEKLNQFINQHQNLGLSKPIYIFQELYHDAFIRQLKLDASAINIVQFNGDAVQNVTTLTLASDFDTSLANRLRDLATF